MSLLVGSHFFEGSPSKGAGSLDRDPRIETQPWY